MPTAKERRLSRLFGPDGRTLLIAADHGMTMGPDSGMPPLGPLLRAVVAGGADGVVLHRGPARRDMPAQRGTALLVHLSGGTTLSPGGDVKALVAQPEDAAALGADAVSVHLTLGCGAADDRAGLADLGRVASACDRLGLPLLVMTYVRAGGSDPGAAALHAARVAAEAGADVVKAASPDLTTTRALAELTPVPVVVAGGAKGEGTWDGFVDGARDALAAGVAGLCIGRWVFTHPDPEKAVRELRDLVHPCG